MDRYRPSGSYGEDPLSKMSAIYDAARVTRFNRIRGDLGGSGDSHLTDQDLWNLRERAREYERNGTISKALFQRIADNDQNRVRGMPGCFFGDAFDYVHVRFYQVIPAHPRFSGQTGGYDHNIRIFRRSVVIGTGHIEIMAFYRSSLQKVEGFPLG